MYSIDSEKHLYTTKTKIHKKPITNNHYIKQIRSLEPNRKLLTCRKGPKPLHCPKSLAMLPHIITNYDWVMVDKTIESASVIDS